MSMRRSPRFNALLAALFLLGAGLFGAFVDQRGSGRAYAASSIQHYEYVVTDGVVYVYDIDNSFHLVKQFNLPVAGVRGLSANVNTGLLYVSYGGDGGPHGNGSMLAYNLLTGSIVWTQNYSFGIDSMDITPDGKTIYMPDGERSYDATWHIIDAATGNVTGSIVVAAGDSAHNTLVNASGTHVYLGGLNYNRLAEVDTSTNQVIQRIGPVSGSGVRPFTINKAETLAYTTASGFIGFDVGSITTGQELYSVAVPGFTAPAGSNAPSHGITLSPDEKTIYLVDNVYDYVHVYDVSGVPAHAPVHLADIHLTHGFTGQESPCLYDCALEGWILYTDDGHYVLVGDSGDIIDTSTMTVAYYLDPLRNTRKYLEVDWSNGLPVYATSRMSVNLGSPPATTLTPGPTATATQPPTITPTSTPTSTPTPGMTPTSTPSPTSTPASGTLATDTFQRANQSLWGTASDGQTWGGDANAQSFFSIVNNTGHIGSTGSNSYSAVLGASATSSEVYLTGSLTSFASSNFGPVLRWSDGNNWYKAYIDGGHLVIQKKVSGTTTTLASVAFTASAGTLYTLHFRAVGTTLSASAWPASGSEPAAWMATASDSAFSSGLCGLRVLTQTNAATITSFVAKTV